MLTRLELVGFKSFADKTRFDFAPGITAVVGPNGSGKSNVVDAVRWILGEQSARSLRGGEMADVIFNGSSSRKSLGMAEVTVTFDNSRKLLAVDADEVQISRRVYRDGTGEYLINGQMSRLKDIKEIFLGSGAGAGGYTVIAQGRVDELLQASTTDRRVIFDEAAGISRFKAKKTETLRKLAAVEGNLTRARDRLDGLDSQLRNLRMQAAKAQKHREYSDRLRELRVGLGLREFREFSAALESDRQVLAGLKAEVSGASARVEELEQAARSLDWQVGTAEDALRHQEARLAEARQQIAGFDATLRHERAATAEQEAELLRAGRKRADLGYRLKGLEADVTRATADAAAAGDRLDAEQHQADAAAVALAAVADRVADLDRQRQDDQARQMDLVRRQVAARSAADHYLAEVGRLQREYVRKLGDVEQNAARRAALESALHGLSQADADLQARLTAARGRLTETTTERDHLRAEQERVQQGLAGLRVQQGDLRGRIEVLEGLERSLEGLGAGVRDVLKLMNGDLQLKIEDEGPRSSIFNLQSPISHVVGLVADLLTVPRDVAPLVELALGDATQRFVVRDPSQVDAVAAAVGDVAGRVGFVPIQRPNPPAPFPAGEGGDSSPVSGSPARDGEGFRSLATFIRCDHPDLASLPDQLLGNVILADTLADARQVAATHPGFRFVTRAGELLEPDGTLTVGPLKAEAGIVSRKSELRELRQQFRGLAADVSAAEVELAELRRRADAVGGVIEAVEAEIGMLSGEAGDLQQQIARQRQQVEELDDRISLARQEAVHLEAEVRTGEAAWVATKQEADAAEAEADALGSRLDELRAAIRAGEQDRDRLQQAHTAAQVELSRAAADRDRLRDRQAQLEAEQKKRKIEAMDAVAALGNARNRLAESLLAMLRATAGMADAYAEKEARERQAAELAARAAAGRAARERTRDELHSLRADWQGKQAEAHARELAVHNLTARRDAVANRILEDYAIDLALLASEGSEPGDDAGDRPDITDVSAANVEIDELKRKLARLGSVNMEALDELARVEAEFNALQAQHDDLTAARKSLQDVIDTINADSRKLFTDTLSAVRGYFQELFRKLFAGGQADVILEDPADVLESGIEITARPPGKELRSLSLLSGGEKTLTAVALLLAIFRNRPSPFCILDEVDAALDEANTTRLAGVLREFLDRSQFIVITHKKRTMAAADRLWGVTMQESGVSRLLPMRFEDWPDEGANAEDAA
jgi:chromosome segregation protein